MNVSAGKQQQKKEPVDLVHLSSNLKLYTDWDEPKWHAFMDLAKLDKQATFVEAQQCLSLCLQLDLNPARNEIYFIRRKGKLVPQTSIVGFHKVAHGTKMLAGFTKPEWCGEDEVWREVWNKAKHGGPPLAARIGVLHKEYTEPAYAVAHWTDYCPEEAKDRFMWDKMSAHMLLKCAKACCLRENFPVLSGIYTDDEMAQAGPGDPIKVRVHDDREYDREFIPDVQTPQVEGDTASPSPDPIQLLQSEFMELATTKWGHLENGARKAAVAEWISTCKALAWLEERGSHSVKASNEEQLRAAIELLQSYDPSSEPATETVEGELVEEDPDLVALIEQYERQLSSIADETQRLDWRKAELARARAEWTAEHEGEPVGKAWGRHNNLADWTDEQRFNWSSYLEGRLEAPTQSEGGLRF